MRFLRMLTNSLLAGALGAAYLTVLVLQLNPEIPLFSDTTWRWFVTLGMLYGVHLAVGFYVLMMLRELFALDGLSPGWASVRVLAWMAAAAAAIAAALMWLNLRGFATALSAGAVERMTGGAVATSVSAVLLLGIAVMRYSFGRRGSRVSAASFVLTACASIALPVAARGLGDTPAVPAAAMETLPRAAGLGPRVVMLLLDGGSLEYIVPRVAEGRLPNFATMLEHGARIDLATIRPTQPDPVWAAVTTGLYPARNGVRSAASYYARRDRRPVDLLPDHCFSHVLVRLGFVDEEPNTSRALEARPLWSILAGAGITSGVVRWPLTYPAPAVPGFVVSDRLHQVVGSIADFDRAAHPPEILPLLQPASSELDAGGTGSDVAREATPESAALGRDRFYSRILRELTAHSSPRFAAVRFEGLDTVGHHYLKYTFPRAVRDIPEEQRRRSSQSLDTYYSFIDTEVGVALQSLAPGDIAVVVSGFGMQPMNPVKQAIGRLLGDPDYSGTHERAPDGFLLAFGTPVEPGRQPRGSIVDVTPTLLYFLGLPIGRDMDGFARTDIFTRTFTSARPLAFIAGYGR